MCTAISFRTANHYFGRNLDMEFSYEESVTVAPRNFQFHFCREKSMKTHFAMIGIAYVKKGYPLFYDATNEKGLSMAGLYFLGNAFYHSEKEGFYNITTFEIIPWVLGQCETVSEARELLQRTNILKLRFDKDLPVAPLHFLVADRESSIVVEPREDGIHIMDNPVGVLTNNPPFEYQMMFLNNYMNLSRKEPMNSFAKALPLEVYSRGMGAIGLPGDVSSFSRFVRGAFVKENSLIYDSEDENVSQFFHILASVEQQKGCVKIGKQEYEYTVYSSCCNTDEGIYYYKTYNNSQITAVNMHLEDIEGEELSCYPLILQQQYCFQNHL